MVLPLPNYIRLKKVLKFYFLSSSFFQDRCFCRKNFRGAGIRAWFFFSFWLFIFPLFCTASVIQVTLSYKSISIYHYDEYTVELLLIYSKQMKINSISFRGHQIPVCFHFQIVSLSLDSITSRW